jgi:hypothetical protein
VSGVQHNAPQVARGFRNAGAAVAQHVRAELARLTAEVTARMKVEAPKDVSVMTNSITAEREGAWAVLIGPHSVYAKWVIGGRRPGKGLPRFSQGLPAVEWLRRRLVDAARAANPKFRKRSRAGDALEMSLEARYMAWSRAVKVRGIKANPFVARTADAFRDAVPGRLEAAVRAGVQAFNAQRTAS